MPTTDESGPSLEALRDVQQRIQKLLDVHNPGEKLGWMTNDRPWTIPPHCLARIEQAGPALHAFFRAANTVFYTTAWVRRVVEKRYHPRYAKLNDAQPDAIPLNPRPDIVPDENWNPKFVELEITVGGRSDAELMHQAFGMSRGTSSVELYKQMLERRGLTDRPVALVCAYHPAYAELLDDLRCHVSLLREAGANVEALLDDDLPYLSYRHRKLACLRPGRQFEFTHFDRLLDIFELAETTHAGMRPLLDAYLDGNAVDLNTSKQFLDEKIWMALFWDRRLRETWQRLIPEEHFAILEQIVPMTVLLVPGAEVRVDDRWMPVERLSELPDGERRLVTKESGTSETSAAAQSFVVLSEQSRDEAREHLDRLLHVGPTSIVQELIESAKVEFWGIDPGSGRRVHQTDARVKMSAFYLDGQLGDILFISSNKQYAVHNDDYLETIVAR